LYTLFYRYGQQKRRAIPRDSSLENFPVYNLTLGISARTNSRVNFVDTFPFEIFLSGRNIPRAVSAAAIALVKSLPLGYLNRLLYATPRKVVDMDNRVLLEIDDAAVYI